MAALRIFNRPVVSAGVALAETPQTISVITRFQIADQTEALCRDRAGGGTFSHAMKTCAVMLAAV